MLLHLLLLLLSLCLCSGTLIVPSSSLSLRKKEQNSLFRKHGGVKLTASTAADIFNSDSKHVITTTADGARSVYAVDVDGDGHMDFLSASYYDDTIAWYKNDGTSGTPSFTEHVITTTANGATSVYAVDVDGDGDMDILSASSGDDTIAWYENRIYADLNCAAGLYPDIVDVITECINCPANSNSLTTGQSGCDCIAGYSSSSGYADGSTACAACNAGEYQDQTGQTSCNACPANSNSLTTGQSGCDCVVGFSSSSSGYADGSTACVACNAGEYQDQTGQTSCIGCAAGSFQDQTAQTSCNECDVGTFSAAGAEACAPCPIGTYADQTGTAACVACPIGFYSDAVGAAQCTQCPAGRVSPAGAVDLSECVSPVPNFAIAHITLVMCVFALVYYVFYGRYNRVAFLKEFRASDLVERYCQDVNRKLNAMLYSTSLQPQTAQERLVGVTLQRSLKLSFFFIFCTILILFIATLVYAFNLARMLFFVLILWMGNVDVNLDDFYEKMDEVVSILIESIHIPWIGYMVYPFTRLFDLLSIFKIDFAAVEVTCVGSQAPMELLVNLLVLGIVIFSILLFSLIIWNSHKFIY